VAASSTGFMHNLMHRLHLRNHLYWTCAEEMRKAKTPHNGEVHKRVLERILSGASDSNVRFEDLRSLLARMGFVERIRGDHHIFSRPGISEILNLQPRGSLAKPYQVKQVRAVIVRYRLGEGVE